MNLKIKVVVEKIRWQSVTPRDSWVLVFVLPGIKVVPLSDVLVSYP